MPVLADQQHAIFLIERDDRYGTGVDEHIAHRLVVTDAHFIAHNRPDPAGENFTSIRNGENRRLIGDLAGPGFVRARHSLRGHRRLSLRRVRRGCRAGAPRSALKGGFHESGE